jgi:signal transduction histidine kinase
VVLLAIFASLAAITIAFNLVLASRLSNEADNVLRDRATAGLTKLSAVNGRLSAPEAPDEAALDDPIWVFAGDHVLERPRVGAAIDSAAASLAGGPPRFLNVPHTETARLYAVPVEENGRRLGTVVAGVSLVPYERTEHIALVTSLILATILFLAVFLAARWSLAAALRPVSRMTEAADDWSEHDLDRRFGLGKPYDELTHLASTLDGLLDRLASSLRREQRFSAELSHELRTPLASIRAEAELALRHERGTAEYREALEAIGRKADEMRRTVETLVAAAREESSLQRGMADAGVAAAAAAEACGRAAMARGVTLEVIPPPTPIRVGTDSEVVERILAPLVENACRFATTTVRMGVVRDGGAVRYCVEDDGPGVLAVDRERIFEPGVRGVATGRNHGSQNGAGLGLALARRLARAVGGDVQADMTRSGARFSVRLPSG